MAKRKPTIAKQIELENEADFLEFINTMLADAGVSDPRREQGLRYPFESVMTIMVLGMVGGNESCAGVAAYAEWLLTWLDLPKPTPIAKKNRIKKGRNLRQV